MTKLIALANMLIVIVKEKCNDLQSSVLHGKRKAVMEMARAGLDKDIVVECAAKLANEIGLENLTLKIVAKELGVQTPSLYNHIKSLDDLKRNLMVYGWKQMEQQIVLSVVGVSGYDALRAMCYAFYEYATANPGVFNTMLWYNKFDNDETVAVTEELFVVLFKIMGSLQISQEHINHLIRTFRSFLEGFSLLVNHGAFGSPISIRESFEMSVEVLLAGVRTLENYCGRGE